MKAYRFQKEFFQFRLQLIEIHLVNRFLNTDCGGRRNHGFKLGKDLLAVNKGNFFIRQCNLAHVVFTIRLVYVYCFQIAGHQQKTVNR